MNADPNRLISQTFAASLELLIVVKKDDIAK